MLDVVRRNQDVRERVFESIISEVARHDASNAIRLVLRAQQIFPPGRRVPKNTWRIAFIDVAQHPGAVLHISMFIRLGQSQSEDCACGCTSNQVEQFVNRFARSLFDGSQNGRRDQPPDSPSID